MEKPTVNQEEKDKSKGEQQLVIFDLAGEYYGVDIGDVREIIRMQAITRIPGAPHFVEGVTNLRGNVVPVLDLRKRLNRQVKEVTKETRIVVVYIDGDEVGVIVDGVTEVLSISQEAIEPPSHMATDPDSDYLRGVAKLDTKLIILLDLYKALSGVIGKNALTKDALNTDGSSDMEEEEASGNKARSAKSSKAKSDKVKATQ